MGRLDAVCSIRFAWLLILGPSSADRADTSARPTRAVAVGTPTLRVPGWPFCPKILTRLAVLLGRVASTNPATCATRGGWAPRFKCSAPVCRAPHGENNCSKPMPHCTDLSHKRQLPLHPPPLSVLARRLASRRQHPVCVRSQLRVQGPRRLRQGPLKRP